MGCCKGSVGNVRRKVVGATAICANCRGSLREQLRDAVAERTKIAVNPGTYSVTAQIKCPNCSYENRLVTSFVKR